MVTLKSYFWELDPQLPGFTMHVLVIKIKNICQDGFMIIQIFIVIKGWDILELLR